MTRCMIGRSHFVVFKVNTFVNVIKAIIKDDKLGLGTRQGCCVRVHVRNLPIFGFFV